MKFTVFRQDIRPSRLKQFPEYKHFSLPEDRWVLARCHLGTIWPSMTLMTTSCVLVWLIYLGLREIWKSDQMHLAMWVASDVFKIDFFTLALVGMGLTFLIYPFVIMIPTLLYAARSLPRREARVLHRILRARNILYCPAFKCRYNCTGIRGNTCPECGTAVPGLAASE